MSPWKRVEDDPASYFENSAYNIGKAMDSGFMKMTCLLVPHWSLTWNLKISPWKRRFLLETIIFRFHVKLQGCKGNSFWNDSALNPVGKGSKFSTASWNHLLDRRNQREGCEGAHFPPGDLNGCFRKWWYPQIIHFSRDFHYKSSILGYPFFWKHPNGKYF